LGDLFCGAQFVISGSAKIASLQTILVFSFGGLTAGWMVANFRGLFKGF
jgi:hypothetical protein